MKIRFLSLIIFIFCGVTLYSQTLTVEALADPEESESITETLPFPLSPELEEFYQYAQADSIMRLAIVLSDIYSKKDMEFTRGFLMGIKKSSLPENSISLKIINGEISEDSLKYELEIFEPHVIFDTFEKDAPRQLLTYTQLNNNKLIKVFDAKGDEFRYNSAVYQLLAPSESFNASLTRYFMDNYKGNTLFIIGDPDPTEQMMRDLILAWPEDELLIANVEDLSKLSFDTSVNYLVMPVATSNREVKEVLTEIVRMISEVPGAGVRIIGRPNWIAFNDLNSMIANLEVFIPSKCYFEPASESGKKFISDYNTLFSHTPIRSYPVYAVMGYDSAQYLIPGMLNELKGNSYDWQPANLLQSYFNLSKSGWAGYYNNGSFILHFEPWGTMTKEKLN